MTAIPHSRPRSVARLAGLAGLALAALFVLAVPTVAPVRAASAVEIGARALMAGRYEAGGWVAIAVSLENPGSPTEGWLSAEGDGGSVRRFVEMPAGASKVVTLYVQPGGFQRAVEVVYREAAGSVRALADVSVLPQSREHVAIVGDPNGALRAQVASAAAIDAPAPIVLAAADIPERPEPLEGMATIVWAANETALTEDARRALERWVADGGQLVVVGGAEWQARTDPFEALLPVEALRAQDDTRVDGVAAWAGADAPPIERATVSTGRLRDDAHALVTGESGEPVLSWRPHGAGRVVFAGVDLANDAWRGWEGSPAGWARILESRSLIDAFFGDGIPERAQAESSIAQALSNLPSLAIPPVELLLAVIVGYIVLIGPVSYLVLHRIDRRELAWITAPLLVVVFSGASFGIGIALKGTEVIVNQVSVVRTSAGGTAAGVETYAGVFSPTRGTYDLAVDADALLGGVRPDAFAEGDGQTRTAVDVEQGQPSRLRGLSIGSAGFAYVRAGAVVPHEPALAVTWRSEGGATVGTVTNVGTEPLDDVAFISIRSGELIGDLAPGASGDFVVEASDLNAASASDQIYGFGGLGDAGEEARRLALLRRGVIDALVGYEGGLVPGAEMGGVGARGPYLIGWRSGDGPTPILLDGVTPQRHGQIAEVLSVRPAVTEGPTVVRPARMGVTVQLDGDATMISQGAVQIGAGTAVFGISLPLEATQMEVGDVEIIAGFDASSVFFDPGNVVSAWPASYRIQVRDQVTGRWVRLGNLSEASRFTIADPASVVSDTGRIEVRVRSAGVDPAFGVQSIFVSAQAEGVLGR